MIELVYDSPQKPKPRFPLPFRRRDRSIPVPPTAEAVSRVQKRLDSYGKASLEMHEDLHDFLEGKSGADRQIRVVVSRECAEEGIVFTPAPSVLSEFLAHLGDLLRLK